MYTITDAIIMTARVNNRNADGNPQFWKCEQEFQVPGVTNTELSPERLVTDILHGEQYNSEDACNAGCGYIYQHAYCMEVVIINSYESGDVTTTKWDCECNEGYVPSASGTDAGTGYINDHCVECLYEVSVDNKCNDVGTCETGYVGYNGKCTVKCNQDSNDCHADATCLEPETGSGVYGCVCNEGYTSGDLGETCTAVCNQGVDCPAHASCQEETPTVCSCDAGYSSQVSPLNCIDECERINGDICHEHAVCKDSAGTGGTTVYTCTCKVELGYYGDGIHCVEADAACTAGSDNCLSACTAGSDNNCLGACDTGYVGDGANCNECLTCGTGWQCSNEVTVDSGTCCTECTDIEECTTDVDEDKHECITDDICTELTGSYTCDCILYYGDGNSEYYGDGKTTGTGCTACDVCTSTEYCEAYNDDEETCCKEDKCKACDYTCTGDNEYCSDVAYTCPGDNEYCSDVAYGTCCKQGSCPPKKYGGADCTDNDGNPDGGQCKSGVCNTRVQCTCEYDYQCTSGDCDSGRKMCRH